MIGTSRGKAEIDIELYDRFKEMERQFKAHSIVEFSGYGDLITFYSRDAFDLNIIDQRDKARKELGELQKAHKEACAKIQELESKTDPPKVKELSIFQFIKLKLRG